MPELKPGDSVKIGGTFPYDGLKILAVDGLDGWLLFPSGVHATYPLSNLELVPETITVTLNLEDAQNWSNTFIPSSFHHPILEPIRAALSAREAKQ